jgi:hypothetical protein
MKTRVSAVRSLVWRVSLSAILVTAPLLGGCGGAWYGLHVSSAAARVEEARAQGAEQLAPYEYYYAREHLHQAQIEASEASYSDAANYAEIAEEYATKAIQLSQSAASSGATAPGEK